MANTIRRTPRAVLLTLGLVASLLATTNVVGPIEPAAAQAAVAIDPDSLSPHPVPGGGVLGFTQSSADTQSWQVHAFAQVGDRIFVGGSFTEVVDRPWAGATTWPQPFLAAFDLDTNDFIDSWTPTLDDPVWALEEYNGNLIVGGEFDTVNGTPRQGLVMLDPVTGAIVPGFAAEIDNVIEPPAEQFEATVRALELDGDDLYVVGEFNRLIDADDAHGVFSVARVSAIDGDWDPTFDARPTGGSVYDVTADPVGGRVIMAGTFTSVNATPSTLSAAVVDRTTGASLAGYPIELNGAWTRSYVTVVDGSTYWIGGEQHLAQARDADDWSLIGCITTGAIGPEDPTRCTNWTDGAFGGGDYQIGELLAPDVLLLGCHCRGNYFSTFTGNNNGEQLGYNAAGIRFYRSDGSEYDFRANMPTWGEGPYAAFADTNGCLYLGGDFSGIAQGFGRFCNVADVDGDGLDDLDEDGDGIIDWRDDVMTTGDPVSRAGVATQSSVFNDDVDGFGPANAHDGNRGTIFNAHPLTITQQDLEPWWEVDLGAPTVLSGINIFNRTDDQPERLDDVEVLIGDAPFGAVDLATARAAATWSVVLPSTDDIAQISLPDITGQYVRLQLPDQEFLQIGEVDVFESVDTDGDGIGDHRDNLTTTGTIVSGAGTATQSSDFALDTTADRAIDGVRDGDNAVSPIAATLTETEPWWEVDLGSAHLLDGLNLYNRTDCCTELLADFDILIGDDPFGAMTLAEARAAATWSTTVAGEAGELAELSIPDIVGRYLRIQLPIDSALNLAEVDVIGVPSDLPPFGTPANVQLETNGVDEVTVTWEPVANAKGYLVHRDFVFLQWLPTGSTSLVDDTVVEGETYRYQVRAQAADDSYSDPSPTESITVFSEENLPPFGTPGNPTVSTNGIDEVTVGWDLVADAKGYLVHRNGQFVQWLSFTQSSWTDTNVVQGDTYGYEIRAQRPDNTYSDPTDALVVTVSNDPPPPPFGTPGNPTVSTNGIDEVTVGWDLVADAKGYLVHRNGQFVQWLSFTESSWTDTNVVQGDTYGYEIRAQRPDNTYSDPTSVLVITVSNDPPPPPFGTPANVQLATNGVDEVTVSWDLVADAKGYVIHRDFQYVGFVTFSESSFVDDTVAFGNVYGYQVRAQAADNSYSDPSAIQDIAVGEDNEDPTVPQNVTLTVEADGSITVDWDPSTDNIGVDSYLVHRDFVYRAFTNEPTTDFNDDQVLPGTLYRYQVRARDGAGNISAPSDIVSITTP